MECTLVSAARRLYFAALPPLPVIIVKNEAVAVCVAEQGGGATLEGNGMRAGVYGNTRPSVLGKEGPA